MIITLLASLATVDVVTEITKNFDHHVTSNISKKTTQKLQDKNLSKVDADKIKYEILHVLYGKKN